MRWGAARLTTVALVAVGSMALPAPQAQATGIYTALFDGLVLLAGPIGSPCVPATPGTPKCPAITTPSPTPTGKLTPLFTTNGNLQTGIFASTLCTDFGTWTLKPGKPPGHVGICTVGAAFAINGFCGLAHGAGTGVVIDSIGQGHGIVFTFTIEGMAMTLRGNATKGSQVGDVHGTADVIENPVDPGNCATKTATQFLLGGGHISITYPKALP